MARTGNGSTLTLSGGFSVRFETFEPQGFKVDELNNSYLGSTTWEEIQPADLKDPGGFKATWQFDGTIPPVKTVQTATLVFYGSAGSKTLTGSGFVMEFVPPKAENNAKQIAELTFRFDGAPGGTGTVPTWS